MRVANKYFDHVFLRLRCFNLTFMNLYQVLAICFRFKFKIFLFTVQDSYGDTALHDAIGKENTDIVEALATAPTIDFTLRNKRGFNVLHHAALKGNHQ